jgi:hypothetical protein
LICLHGAGTGPWIFRDWSDFAEWTVKTPDLQEGLNVANANRDGEEEVGREAAHRGHAYKAMPLPREVSLDDALADLEPDEERNTCPTGTTWT